MEWKKVRVGRKTLNKKRKKTEVKDNCCSPGKTQTKPSSFSISSLIGKVAIDSSLSEPSKANDGYMFVPIPSQWLVSLAMANWFVGKHLQLNS